MAAAVCFTWLGMVLAISFLGAPLKFRAPGVTLQIGLNRRTDRVLAGEELPRSRGHLGYVALEVVKVALLVAAGSTALVPA